MDRFRTVAALAGLLTGFGTLAQASGPNHYRLTEVRAPDSMTAGCLATYSKIASITAINDLGIVNGSVTCYTAVDPATGVLQFNSATFAAAPWFGSVELPLSGPGQSYSYTINNRNELFGYEIPNDAGGFFATKWSLAGGRERIFFNPACDEPRIQFQAAVDGNARHIVGWGLRGDPNLPPPIDTWCLRQRWVIRDADGVETLGPLDGSPASLNSFSVAVGIAARAAIRYDVPTGQTRVLHAPDDTHSAEATNINDLGEAAGRIVQDIAPGNFSQCSPGVAVRWDRNDLELVLPHLPGAVSSRAWAVGYGGETIGDSGAGEYCTFADNSGERAVLWEGNRVFDLNTLIPRSERITLTYAYSINRRGQITASGYRNDEPLVLCPRSEFDPTTNTSSIVTSPCHNTYMFVLTPVGRQR